MTGKSEQPAGKSPRALKEEETLALWRERGIFKKSMEKDAPAGEFVFYDGPPFATGLPHYGSLLSSIIKDVMPRYKTMRGHSVRRVWGWDCHGLPVESLVEKKLGLKSKKDIEELGVAKFNEEARAMVLQYATDWEYYIERVGRWVEFKGSYKTMDNSYIESVWWGLKKMHDDKRLYEGRKVLMYCPHCETPLAKAEIAMDNSYEDVTEEAVFVTFKIKEPSKHDLPENTFFLAWTTTPWTLPGNVALAVGKDIDYSIMEREGAHLVVASSLKESVAPEYSETKTAKGASLIGVAYEPLFDIPKVRAEDKGAAAWKVYAADFVGEEDGTGIVHTAVIYGEDDFALGKEVGLPMVPLLDPSGRFNEAAPALVRGKYFKQHSRGFPQAKKGEDAESAITSDLEKRGLLFKKESYTHSYPHCYRCGTPLIYNALTSWFIDIQSVKERLLKHNEEINWFPEHLKHGRFKNIIENAPDWTISRNRFWASPLPVWKNETTGETVVIGSLDELKTYTKKSGNSYFVMRHGEAESNVLGVASSTADRPHPLTEKGRADVQKSAEEMKKAGGVDLIIASPFVRTRETAEIVARVLGYPQEAVMLDERFGEINTGEFDGRPIAEYRAFYGSQEEKFTKRPKSGENWCDVKNRVGNALYDLEKNWSGKRILIVAHDSPLLNITAVADGLDIAGTALRKEMTGTNFFEPGEWRELAFVPLPHRDDFTLDLHRPYIDDLELVDTAGNPLTRIPDVLDCWVESGSMPFAEWHYPSENKEAFEKRFPGDFIAEYIAQTRTWFYYMHAIGTLLFDAPTFKNVVTTGTILAADGSKMSKSKGNYTDPLENLDRYGADALRYYLMSSVVMQAEDLNFRDDALREAHNRVINILWNTQKFFSLYKDDYDTSVRPGESANVLDQWILALLGEVGSEMTSAMERFDLPRATRPIEGFVNDFSTWYVRRSRDRMKAGDSADKQHALATMRYVLIEFSKLIAPILPFIADEVYREAGGERESVHLELWPDVSAGEHADALEAMKEVRRLVSLALEVRARSGIKIRQPLASVTFKTAVTSVTEDSRLRTLIADELNVKSVGFDESQEEEVLLDTTLTPELKEEGALRDLIRAIQDARKKNGLAPGEMATLSFRASPEGRAIVAKYGEEIRRQTGCDSLTIEDGESMFDTLRIERK